MRNNEHRRSRMQTEKTREPYAKPVLVRHENLRDVTFECPDWQCSVAVPGDPSG
jgi:hypothetical protein